LPFIDRLQQLIEEVDKALSNKSAQTPLNNVLFEIRKLKKEFAEIKASMSFPLSESREPPTSPDDSRHTNTHAKPLSLHKFIC
jgi:hypothetical protein